MTAVLDTVPVGTQAAILDRVLAERYPRHALPTIASHFRLTIADLQTIVRHRGWPDRQIMAKARDQLTREAAQETQEPAQAAVEAVDDLDARAHGEERPARRTGLVRVRVEDLHPDPDNLREHVAHRAPAATEDDVDELAASIQSVGLLQPPVVRIDGDRLVLVMGHRRHRALQRLQWTHVDVIIRQPMRPDEVVAAMLIENGHRRDLDPIEEARGIHRLREDGLTDVEIARKIGRSQNYVSGRRALLALTAEEQERIRTGAMPLGEATNLGRVTSGRTRASSKKHVTTAHFGPVHTLAHLARARCARLHENLPVRRVRGGEACGECWETVIRADERSAMQSANLHAPACVTCGQEIER